MACAIASTVARLETSQCLGGGSVQQSNDEVDDISTLQKGAVWAWLLCDVGRFPRILARPQYVCNAICMCR